MKRISRAAFLALLAAPPFLHVAPAQACTVPPCNPARLILPLNDATIPANAPALFGYTTTGDSISLLELRPEDGGIHPTTTEVVDGITLLKLGAPLWIGVNYRIAGQAGCIFDAGAPATGESLLRVAAEAPLPTTIGPARVEYYAARLGSSAQPNPTTVSKVAVAEIAISPSVDLTPYLALTNFTTTLDGHVWADSKYGRGVQSREARRDVVTRYEFMRVFAGCGNVIDSCAPNGTTPGRHEVQITAHVAGATADPPPLSFTIDLDCDADGGPGDPGDGGPGSLPDVVVTDVIQNPDGIAPRPDVIETDGIAPKPDAIDNPDVIAPRPDVIDNPDVIVHPQPEAGTPLDASGGPDGSNPPANDASTGPGNPSDPRDAGCGCSVAGGRSGGSALGVLWLVPAALAWARRRSRRGQRR